MKSAANIVLAGIFSMATFSASSQTITPFNTQVSSSGSEVITDYMLTYPDGSSEVFTAWFGDEVFQVAGSATIPSVGSLPLDIAVTPPGGGGTNPNPPVMPYDSQVPPEIRRGGASGGVPETQWVNLVIVAGGFVVSAGACTAGWYATRRALISSCRAQGRGWDSITVGRCGIAGASSIDCEDQVDEANNNVLSWNQFSNTYLPWSYYIDGYILDLSIPNNSGY